MERFIHFTKNVRLQPINSTEEQKSISLYDHFMTQNEINRLKLDSKSEMVKRHGVERILSIRCMP